MNTKEKLMEDWEREFYIRFVVNGEVGGSYDVAGEPAHHIIDFIKALLTSEVEKERERLLGEIENEKEDEYTMGFEDGVEQNLKEYKKTLFLQLESKGTFVNAYANGPLLVDSIIIPMDDWLKIKRQRKALSDIGGKEK